MKKNTVTTFICDYCSKCFKNPLSCSKHEQVCKILSNDKKRLTRYIDVLVSHYHKLGYTIELKYSDTYDVDTIVDLKLRK